MAIRPILQEGDAALRGTSLPVPPELFGSEELLRILTDMEDTLDKEADGVALAAPQIGVLYRIFIVRYDRMREAPENDETVAPELGVFINPEFVKSSRRREEMQEGCLSVRGLYGTTVRHSNASVRAQDAQGQWFERGGGGILAQAFQHETDHLDGVLFIDHALETHVPEPKQNDATEHS